MDIILIIRFTLYVVKSDDIAKPFFYLISVLSGF